MNYCKIMIKINLLTMDVHLFISYNLGPDYNYNPSESIKKVIDYPLGMGLFDSGHYTTVYDYHLCMDTIRNMLKLDEKYTIVRVLSKKKLLNSNRIDILDYVNVYINDSDYYKVWNRKNIIEDLI